MGITSPCKLLVLRDRLAAVQSGDALLLVSLNGKYNSILPLKSPLDRFLAVARIPGTPDAPEQLVAITATGLVGVRINMARIAQGDPS